MSIRGATDSYPFVRGARFFCGLQSKQRESLTSRLNPAAT